MSDINIKIEGRQGVGKSTILYIIKEALEERGIVNFTFDEPDEIHFVNMDRKIETIIRKDSHIHISEVQLNKSLLLDHYRTGSVRQQEDAKRENSQ